MDKTPRFRTGSGRAFFGTGDGSGPDTIHRLRVACSCDAFADLAERATASDRAGEHGSVADRACRPAAVRPAAQRRTVDRLGEDEPALCSGVAADGAPLSSEEEVRLLIDLARSPF